MNRRTLTTMALVFSAILFATALPQIGFAQSDPLVGIWQLNLAKSKYSPGPPPKSSDCIPPAGWAEYQRHQCRYRR